MAKASRHATSASSAVTPGARAAATSGASVRAIARLDRVVTRDFDEVASASAASSRGTDWSRLERVEPRLTRRRQPQRVRRLGMGRVEEAGRRLVLARVEVRARARGERLGRVAVGRGRRLCARGAQQQHDEGEPHHDCVAVSGRAFSRAPFTPYEGYEGEPTRGPSFVKRRPGRFCGFAPHERPQRRPCPARCQTLSHYIFR